MNENYRKYLIQLLEMLDKNIKTCDDAIELDFLKRLREDYNKKLNFLGNGNSK